MLEKNKKIDCRVTKFIQDCHIYRINDEIFFRTVCNMKHKQQTNMIEGLEWKYKVGKPFQLLKSIRKEQEMFTKVD